MHPRVYGCEIRMRLVNAIYVCCLFVLLLVCYVVHNMQCMRYYEMGAIYNEYNKMSCVREGQSKYYIPCQYKIIKLTVSIERIYSV